jgi:hypothetical protein
MSKHDYTPQQALELLARKLSGEDQELAAQVQSAVNGGKDVQETERTGKRNSRFYRHTVPYSPDEALHVALSVLRGHFIEQPLFVNSCYDAMAKAAIGVGDARRRWISKREVGHSEIPGAETTIEIEVQTETEIIPSRTVLTDGREETLPMVRTSVDIIKEQQVNLDRVRELIDFTER